MAYPRHPLNLALEAADALRELGGSRVEVPKSLLAMRLKAAEDSGDFIAKVGSTKQFGLIEGKSSFTLTEAAKQYFFPTDPETKRLALLSFLRQPEAFAKLIEAFDGGRLPQAESIGHKLVIEFGVPDIWSPRVARFFVRSAETVGALDEHGFLRYNAAIHTAGAGTQAKVDSLDSVPYPERADRFVQIKNVPPQNDVSDQHDQTGVIVWKYPCEGKMLRIETPENMSLNTWEKLNRYIQVLKPE